jgi:hypothetical protein
LQEVVQDKNKLRQQKQVIEFMLVVLLKSVEKHLGKLHNTFDSVHAYGTVTINAFGV